MRAVGSLAVSIGAMILGAAVLGVVIASVSGVVLVVIEGSETGSRALANLDRGESPVICADLSEARSAWLDRRRTEVGGCQFAGVGLEAKSAAPAD